MPIETSAQWITDLVNTNPVHSDALAQADGHLRLIKLVLQNCFPNLNGAVTCTPAELNQLHTGNRTIGHADGTLGAPSIYFDSENTLGLYKASAGHLGVSKRIVGNGTMPVGSVVPFILDPGTTLCARGGTATGAEQYVEPDGSTYNNTTFPDLAAFLGQGGTTFVVPDWKTAGKFLRHRTGSVTVGTAQANQNAAHTHSLSVNGVPTGGVTVNANATGIGASVVAVPGLSGQISAAGGNYGVPNGAATITVSISDPTHAHSASFAGNNLNSTGTSGSQGGTEARPEAYVVFYALKT